MDTVRIYLNIESEPIRRIISLMLEGQGYEIVDSPMAAHLYIADYADRQGVRELAIVRGAQHHGSSRQTLRLPFEVGELLKVVQSAAEGAQE